MVENFARIGSSLAQWKRARLITERSVDRNYQLLFLSTKQQYYLATKLFFDLAISLVLASLNLAPIAQLVRAPCL